MTFARPFAGSSIQIRVSSCTELSPNPVRRQRDSGLARTRLTELAACRQSAIADIDTVGGLSTIVDHVDNLARQRVGNRFAFAVQDHLFGPQEDRHQISYDMASGILRPENRTFPGFTDSDSVFEADNPRLYEVGIFDKFGNEAVDRVLVDLVRAANLLYLSVRHDRDAVAHRERLFLVVGHENERNARFTLKLFEFLPHGLAKLEIESRQRCIEKQHLRSRCKCTGQSNALLLATGKLRRSSRGKIAEFDQTEHVPDRRIHLVLRSSEPLEAEGNVLRYGHVRKQRIVLEDRIHGPLIGRQVLHVLSEQQDLAFRRLLEAGDQAKHRGLATARRTEQGEELVALNGQRHAIERGHFTPKATGGRHGAGCTLHAFPRRN